MVPIARKVVLHNFYYIFFLKTFILNPSIVQSDYRRNDMPYENYKYTWIFC